MTKIVTRLVIKCRSNFLFMFGPDLENKEEGNNLSNYKVWTMANMDGISSCKLGWSCLRAILQHINFSFSDLNLNSNYVVNVMSALYLIISRNKKHFK